jgi:hypothetical protein
MGERLNTDRIDKWISLDNPELERLNSIAEHGMSVPVAKGFTSNGTKGKFPPLRPKYVRMASTVNKLLHSSFVSKRLAVILPKKSVLALRVTAALSAAGWTEASGKVKGCPIIDPKVVNSKEAKPLCDEIHGKIVHPTLQNLVRQIMDFFEEAMAADPSVTWPDLAMFKMDLAGAFTLISSNPDDVYMMGSELTEDKVIFILCGVFG